MNYSYLCGMDEDNPYYLTAEQKREVHRAYRLLKDDDFFVLYERLLPSCRTGKEAFEMIDEQVFQVLGRYRFAEYGSFRVVLHLWRKKNPDRLARVKRRG